MQSPRKGLFVEAGALMLAAMVLAISKYLLNHSFMLPGMVTVVAGVLIALALSTVVHI